MPILYDLWENPVEITQSYVSHRNRLIDIHLVHTFHAKGRKLLINTFKQNDHVPTMCIFFDNKEKAEEAYETMKEVYYGPLCVSQKHTQTQPELSTSQMLNIFLVTCSPLLFLILMLFATLPVAKGSVLFLSP
jgi:hypothetical protein